MRAAAVKTVLEELAKHWLEVRDLGGASVDGQLDWYLHAEGALGAAQDRLQRHPFKLCVLRPIEHGRAPIAHQQEADARVELHRPQ